MAQVDTFERPETNHRVISFSYNLREFTEGGQYAEAILRRFMADLSEALIEDLKADIIKGLDIPAIQKELSVTVAKELARQLTENNADVSKFGLCPYCNAQIKDYHPPVGRFAPEAYEAAREAGIDPSTGHKQSCDHKDIKL